MAKSSSKKSKRKNTSGEASRAPSRYRHLAGRKGDMLALGAGALLPLAFAPFDLFPFAILSLLFVFLAWCDITPRRALWRGWLYGVGAFGVGVSWVVESFQFSHIHLAIAILLTTGFVLFLALYPAAVGYGAQKFVRRELHPWQERVYWLCLVPALWTLVEWLRGWFFTGFTWLQLGYSQADHPLEGWLPVVGVYGVSLLLAVTAGGCLLLVKDWRQHWPWVAPLVAGVWVLGPLLGLMQWTAPSGQPIQVALIQGNVAQSEKWRPENREPTMRLYAELTRKHWNADLVVWPETALPGQLHEFASFLEPLQAEARREKTDILFGVPAVNLQTRQFFNSVVLIGERPGIYYKRHLVPFGEYLPFDAVLRPITDTFGIPVSSFSRGVAQQVPLITRGVQLSLSICYEIAFGNEVIRGLPDAGLIATVSNDAWFGDSVAPHQHLQIAQVRAVETGRDLIRATNTGISAIVNHGGHVVARSKQFETAVLTGEVTPRDGATPYVVVGDWPVLAIALLGVVVGASVVRRAKQPNE